MHPIGCLLSGLLAALLFSIGGDFARRAIEVQIWIALLVAGTSIPDPWIRHKGAWIVGSFLGRPALMVRGLDFAGLNDEERQAVIAHEFGHTTLLDRIWRLVGGAVGGCTVPVIAGGLAVRGIAPDPILFYALGFGSALPALVQHWSLQLSERRADRFAVATLGRRTYVHLLSAKIKLFALAQEGRGLFPEERGESQDHLQASYLEALGGATAVPRRLVARRRFLMTTPVGNGMSEWLTLEGRFVARLVNGRRTVAEIIRRATTTTSLDEFATIRLLYQLKKRDFIG